jgi:hypothetical protein
LWVKHAVFYSYLLTDLVKLKNMFTERELEIGTARQSHTLLALHSPRERDKKLITELCWRLESFCVCCEERHHTVERPAAACCCSVSSFLWYARAGNFLFEHLSTHYAADGDAIYSQNEKQRERERWRTLLFMLHGYKNEDEECAACCINFLNNTLHAFSDSITPTERSWICLAASLSQWERRN